MGPRRLKNPSTRPRSGTGNGDGAGAVEGAGHAPSLPLAPTRDITRVGIGVWVRVSCPRATFLSSRPQTALPHCVQVPHPRPCNGPGAMVI